MYGNVYNPQLDRINNQIAELERMKSQMPIQPITQNFQLAPNREAMKYVGSIDEVQKEIVSTDTPYFSKDMSVLWVKNNKGDIKIYELNEIIPKDEKDIKIEYLQAQIEQLKKEMKQNGSNAIIDEPTTKSIEDEKPTIIETIPRFSKKQK